MTTRKKKGFELPRGLREFEYSLEDLDTAKKLLPRLRDLPEFGMQGHLDRFNKAAKAAEEAEWKAFEARQAARLVAQQMWAEVLNHKRWSTKQIQQATGYDEE